MICGATTALVAAIKKLHSHRRSCFYLKVARCGKLCLLGIGNSSRRNGLTNLIQ
jgi:hypothetical protein